MWKRYVDDTFVIQHQPHKEEFLRHINTVDPSIQFTVEEPKDDGSIPFLDTIITPATDGTFTIGVYRKPTHTDLYLSWHSNHNLAAKYSVINTLMHRAHTICSTPKLLENELQHIEEVLGECKYPRWAIKKISKQHQGQKKKQIPTKKFSTKKCHIVIPYTWGICESIKNICEKHGVAVHFKGGQTLKNILVSPKTKMLWQRKSIIYSHSYGKIDCEEEYIGESGRTFSEWFKENLKSPSPILHIMLAVAIKQQWRL